jgi:hypothetical protein
MRQNASYRGTFEAPKGEWTKVKIAFIDFEGFGWGAVENNMDASTLRRLGVVAIGKRMDATLALSYIGFF